MAWSVGLAEGASDGQGNEWPGAAGLVTRYIGDYLAQIKNHVRLNRDNPWLEILILDGE
jgi:hypothetical protein